MRDDQFTITEHSHPSKVMRTKCERCGQEGYIFPDQLKLAKKNVYRIGELYAAKCCNQRMTTRCRYFIPTDRAMRLQNIRRRESNIDHETAVANF